MSAALGDTRYKAVECGLARGVVNNTFVTGMCVGRRQDLLLSVDGAEVEPVWPRRYRGSQALEGGEREFRGSHGADHRRQ